MNKSYKKKFFFLAIGLICFFSYYSSWGQSQYGIGTSNYAVIESVINNPARIANRMVKWEVSGLNFQLFENNNFYTMKGVFETLDHSKAFDLESLSTIPPSFIKNAISDLTLPVQYYNHTEIRYLSGMYTFGKKKKFGVGLSFATKNDFNIHNFNSGIFSLYNNFRYGPTTIIDGNDLSNFSYSIQDALLLRNTYSEIRVDFGGEIINDEKRRLTLGIALKRNVGIYYNYIKAENLNIRFEENAEYDLVASGDFTHSYSNTHTPFPHFTNFPTNNILGLNGGSGGWATDLGIEYEIKLPKSSKEKKDPLKFPDSLDKQTKDSLIAVYYQKPVDIGKLFSHLSDSVETDCKKNYLFKFSFSLNNIGYINYRDAINNYSIETSQDQTFLFANWRPAMQNITSADNFHKFLLSQPINAQTSNTNQFIFLPASTTGAIDIKIPSLIWPLNRAYLNIGYTQNLILFNAIANRIFSHAFLVPRYETKSLDISFPITIYTDAAPQLPLIKFGVGARYKYVYVGTETFGTVFSRPSSQAISFYIGAKFTMFKDCAPQAIDSAKLSKLIDSNRLEEKIDTDKDGVFDNKDKCLEIPGDTSNFGCPIVDPIALDKSNKASKDVNFITTDTRPIILDGFDINIDSLLDFLNARPDINILVSAYGDDTITVPKEKEALAKARAINTKNILIDKGIKAKRIKNAIGMGFLQPHNTVNTIRIFESGKDDDLDGILDSSDECPTIPGQPIFNGCPQYKSPEQIFLDDIANEIFYEKGTSTLTDDSKKSLERLVDYLNNNPSIPLLLYGTQDTSVMTHEERNKLSQSRAEALKHYLNLQGIDASRLHPLGVNHQQPPNTYSILNFYNKNSDIDKDGVFDYQDRCPTIPGSPSKEGCPYFSNSLLMSLETISQNIQFEIGSSDFTDDSYMYLRQLKKTILSYPNTQILINQQAKEDFLTNTQKDNLAQMRSDKIQTYLIENDIDSSKAVSNGLSYLEKKDAVQKIRFLDPNLDLDNDGILDFEDKCPTLLGNIRDKGCPKSYFSEDIIEKFTKNFYFSPNSDEVPPEAKQELEDLSNYLLVNPQARIITYGQLNNLSATPEFKRSIAQKRAAKFEQYFQSKGIPGNQYSVVDLDPQQDINKVPIVKRLALDEDSDKDGVSEKFDKCPTIKGDIRNHGCPLNEQYNTMQKGTFLTDKNKSSRDLGFINQNLTFSPNSSILSRVGKQAYNDLLEMIKNNPEQEYIIYTKYDPNQKLAKDKDALAKQRAEALKQMLRNNNINLDKVFVIPIGAQQPTNAIDNIQALRNKNKDTDKDRIIDIIDRCPTLKGTKENNGCPVSAKDIQQLQLVASNIYFKTNSSELNPISYSTLDKFIDHLINNIKINSDKNIYLLIYGNTDNIGSNQYNNILSAKRAKTIYNYLIKRNINKKKILTFGLGELNPISTNRTSEGRRRNRRVEFQITRF